MQPRREHGDASATARSASCCIAHAVDVDGHVPGHVQQQVGAGDPPAAYRLVDDHGEAGDVAGARSSRGRGRRARSPSSGLSPQSHAIALKGVTCTTGMPCSGLVLHDRVHGAHRVPRRRVVLEVDRGQVDARDDGRSSARPASTSWGRCSTHHVERLLARAGRPAPRVPSPASPRCGPGRGRRCRGRAAPAGGSRAAPATNEVGPRAVDVPDQDLHGAPSASGTCRRDASPTSSRTASATRRGDTVDRHG